MAAYHLTVRHLSTKDIIRIFRKIRISSTVHWNGIPCWTWTAALDDGGYGIVWWKGRNHYVYRVMYAWLAEDAPSRAEGSLDHLCRNRACCNPVHLENVPMRINILRGMGRTAKLAAQTHCKSGHLLPAPDKRGERICKICKNTRRQQWRAKRRHLPNSEINTQRAKYHNDPEFHAKELQRRRNYYYQTPIEVRRKKQQEYDQRRRSKVRA